MFPVSAQEKSGVVMGGSKILLKSVVSTTSLCHLVQLVPGTMTCVLGFLTHSIQGWLYSFHLLVLHPHVKISVWACAYLTLNNLEAFFSICVISLYTSHPLAEKSSLFVWLSHNPQAQTQDFFSVLMQFHLNI